jgi:stearoyl-CoA desaturase (delta-9 desaturase)
MTVASSEEKLPLDWGVIVFMSAVHILALMAFLPGNFSWGGLVLFFVLHWVTGGLGITMGWHRLVAHRSFQTPKWLEYFLVFCGALSCQGGPIWWVGLHRHHHLYSDQNVDHHDSTKGFWWSHFGWMMHEVPAEKEVARFTQDIADDPFYQFLDRYFLGIQAVLAVILYLIGGWSFVLWGVFLRMVTLYHCTWFVNSATHKFGYRSHESGDRSTNCWWVAVLAYGEGWHNNHHAYQYSARHGLQWWEFDLTWIMIRTLEVLGLAKNVKLPKFDKVIAAPQT